MKKKRTGKACGCSFLDLMNRMATCNGADVIMARTGITNRLQVHCMVACALPCARGLFVAAELDEPVISVENFTSACSPARNKRVGTVLAAHEVFVTWWLIVVIQLWVNAMRRRSIRHFCASSITCLPLLCHRICSSSPDGLTTAYFPFLIDDRGSALLFWPVF